VFQGPFDDDAILEIGEEEIAAMPTDVLGAADTGRRIAKYAAFV